MAAAARRSPTGHGRRCRGHEDGVDKDVHGHDDEDDDGDNVDEKMKDGDVQREF